MAVCVKEAKDSVGCIGGVENSVGGAVATIRSLCSGEQSFLRDRLGGGRSPFWVLTTTVSVDLRVTSHTEQCCIETVLQWLRA